MQSHRKDKVFPSRMSARGQQQVLVIWCFLRAKQHVDVYSSMCTEKLIYVSLQNSANVATKMSQKIFMVVFFLEIYKDNFLIQGKNLS